MIDFGQSPALFSPLVWNGKNQVGIKKTKEILVLFGEFQAAKFGLKIEGGEDLVSDPKGGLFEVGCFGGFWKRKGE